MRWLAPALTLLAVARPALGAPCDTRRSLDRGAPLRSAPGPAGFAGLPEACAASELALQGDASALVAFEDFFGALEAGAALRVRYAPSQRYWLSLWVPGVSYRFVANATVEAESVDLGAGALGAHFALRLGPRAQLSPFARVLLPTESVYVDAMRYGFEHGVAYVFDLHDRVELVGGLAFPLLVTDSFGSLHAVLLPTASVQAGLAAFSWLHVVGGVSLRTRGGEESSFEAFEPALGLRFFPWRQLRAEVGARAPLWGADRTDLGLVLNIGYLLTGAEERP
jgi:hypothetical protein